MKKGEETGAAMLRRLAQEKRQEKDQEQVQKRHEDDALDKLWKQKRAEFGPLLLPAAKEEVMRRAQVAAGRGELTLRVDLGVDEKRMRASSPSAALNFAAAVLSPNTVASSKWEYTSRVGWLLQGHDGQALSEHGHALVGALVALGFTVRFTPFEIKDNYADPFFNAALEIEW